jgi:hypothetical protein
MNNPYYLSVDGRPFILGDPAGSTGTGVAADIISEGNLVTMDAAGGIVLAGASLAAGRYDVIGVAANNALIGTPVQFYTGIVTVMRMRFAVAPAAASNGADVFLSATTGLATLTPPAAGAGNVVLRIGTLKGGNGVTFIPEVWALGGAFFSANGTPLIQTWDADLDAIAALATTGYSARTAANTWALRSFLGGTSITVTNGDGVAGNTTIAARGTLLQHFQPAATTLSPTTIAVAFTAAVPEMSQAITPASASNWIRVSFNGSFSNSNNDIFVAIAIFIDGVEQTGTERRDESQANDRFNLGVEKWFQLSAAAHTIEIRWRVEANTGTANDDDRVLIVQEYGAP